MLVPRAVSCGSSARSLDAGIAVTRTIVAIPIAIPSVAVVG
jgi:hypothetical protein